MRLALAGRPGPITTMTDNEKINLRNEATYSRRLMGTSVTDPATEKCHQCGELLHPYPKPEYWMQYPRVQGAMERKTELRAKVCQVEVIGVGSRASGNA